MGKLKEKMKHDMSIRGYNEQTQEAYLGCMKNFVKYYMKPPNGLGLEHIYKYQVYLSEKRKVSYSFFNQSVCALRFFYKTTLNRDWDIKHIPFQKKCRTLPTVLKQSRSDRSI